MQRMQEIWNLVKGSMQQAQERQKKQADHHCREIEIDFDVGDSVWVTTKERRTGRPIKKLDFTDGGPLQDSGTCWQCLQARPSSLDRSIPLSLLPDCARPQAIPSLDNTLILHLRLR